MRKFAADPFLHEVIPLKKKFLELGSYILCCTITMLITIFVMYEHVEARPTKLDQLEQLIQERFIGEVDAAQLEDAAAAAMVSATGDRWSYYISASEYDSYLERMANAYVGIGITIQADGDGEGFPVISVTAGGPAEEAGVLVNDLIIKVADQDVRAMTTTEVKELIRGKAGTNVSITVLRQGEPIQITIERRQVQTPVATYQMLENNVGLVTIENFDSRCAAETIDAIEALLDDGAQKLIFDVRNNPGGYASEMVEVLDYLLPEGELFRTVSYDGKEHTDYSDADCLEVPMVVLVNSSSYSAAEFFAAALREYGVATIVGEPTVGKGYYQTTTRLNDGSAVALSVGKYYTPNGESLADVGITPDHVIVMDDTESLSLYYDLLLPEDDDHIQTALKILK